MSEPHPNHTAPPPNKKQTKGAFSFGCWRFIEVLAISQSHHHQIMVASAAAVIIIIIIIIASAVLSRRGIHNAHAIWESIFAYFHSCVATINWRNLARIEKMSCNVVAINCI